jgi:OHS family lactose permease-like MFS transporter
MTSKQLHFRFLCGFLFIYFFAQAMSVSLLALWLRSTLKLSGTETGIVFAANFIAAMCSQPVYGFVSDRVGVRKHVLWMVAALVSGCGLFFTYAYAPLLQANIYLGAAVGGLYLGITFIAGSYAIESYVDRIGRRHGFEYSRVRLWGSLGFATAAFMSGQIYNVNPGINFFLASGAGLLLLVLLAFWRSAGSEQDAVPVHNVTLADALGVLRQPQFWRFMVFILGVTNLYLVFDQQFPSYFTSLFPDPATGAAMFGYLNSMQIFIEACGLFLSPLLVKRIGAKNGLLLARGRVGTGRGACLDFGDENAAFDRTAYPGGVGVPVYRLPFRQPAGFHDLYGWRELRSFAWAGHSVAHRGQELRPDRISGYLPEHGGTGAGFPRTVRHLPFANTA